MRRFFFKLAAGMVFAALLGRPAAVLGQAEKKSLDRAEDFILFTGDAAPSLAGSEIGSLSLYACRAGELKPVPFQADKRDTEGRYVFPDEKSRDPKRDGSKLDGNDELVFMAKDAGDRCPHAPRPAGAAQGVEIELSDPQSGGRGWAYLFARPGARPVKTEDYTRYWIERDEEFIATDTYQIGQKLGVTSYDFLRLRRPAGDWSPDLLDRTKVGIRFRLLNGSIPVHVPEGEMKSVVLGVIDGPVRVIRDELDLVKIKALGLDWSPEDFYTYYPNGHVSPMAADIPITLHKIFADISFYWAYDFNAEILGATFKNPSNPGGLLLDGKTSAKPNLKGDNPHFQVAGPMGGAVDVLRFDERLHSLLVRATLLREDLDQADPPEDHPGQLLTGYWVRPLNLMPKGTYRWWLYHYYPYPFSERKVREVLDMIEQPLQLEFHPLPPPAMLE